jgi:hypothetical protein
MLRQFDRTCYRRCPSDLTVPAAELDHGKIGACRRGGRKPKREQADYKGQTISS